MKENYPKGNRVEREELVVKRGERRKDRNRNIKI
jgi:hypothetical protein